ncbi:50S ribosomal protein L3 [uncultured archaeon]|nr:50S ribosomal protein L3 [uncultured archaeon]
MAKTNKPHAGSLAYLPRKRVKKISHRIKNWPKSDTPMPLGFAGYKAGMTHVMATDNRKNTPTSGLEIFIPVTVIQIPPLFVVGIRAYSQGYGGKPSATEVWAEKLPEDLSRSVPVAKKPNTAKKLAALKESADQYTEIHLIVATQPSKIPFARKNPDVMELAIGGDVAAQIAYAEGVLGKEISAKELFKENQHVDVVSVTKGKGFQGVIKRAGTRQQHHKSTKKRRHIGSGGAWVPSRKVYTEHQPGQLGFHGRVELNKVVLKLGEDGTEITPKGGFLRYGPVQGPYVLLHGSIPGPAKRLVRLTQPRRKAKEESYTITRMSTHSPQ